MLVHCFVAGDPRAAHQALRSAVAPGTAAASIVATIKHLRCRSYHAAWPTAQVGALFSCRSFRFALSGTRSKILRSTRSGLVLPRRESFCIAGRRLLLAWRRPSSNLSRCRTRFSFRLRNYGETKDRDQEYKGCHADHDLLHACCPATNTKSPPRIRRVCGVSHCLSSIHQQLHGLHTELRPMCN